MLNPDLLFTLKAIESYTILASRELKYKFTTGGRGEAAAAGKPEQLYTNIRKEADMAIISHLIKYVSQVLIPFS